MFRSSEWDRDRPKDTPARGGCTGKQVECFIYAETIIHSPLYSLWIVDKRMLCSTLHPSLYLYFFEPPSTAFQSKGRLVIVIPITIIIKIKQSKKYSTKVLKAINNSPQRKRESISSARQNALRRITFPFCSFTSPHFNLSATPSPFHVSLTSSVWTT